MQDFLVDILLLCKRVNNAGSEQVNIITTYLDCVWTYDFEVWYCKTLFWALPEEHMAKHASWYLGLTDYKNSFLYTYIADLNAYDARAQSHWRMHLLTKYNIITWGRIENSTILHVMICEELYGDDAVNKLKCSEFSNQAFKTLQPLLAALVCFMIISIFLMIVITFIVTFEHVFFGTSKFAGLLFSISLFIESEKEIAALEDIIFAACVVANIYAWFFANATFIFFLRNFEFYHIFSLVPVLLLFVLALPANVIYDYGALFLSYLRGVGTTTLILLEMMYDVLATMIMFVRLSVQNIRYFLMFAAYFELYEVINMGAIVKDRTWNLNSEFFTIGNFITHPSATLFKTLIMIPTWFVKGMYQLVHLIFTITSHFIAYLALVFWLFSFLYTGFFDERMENYYKIKKSKIQANYKKLFNKYK